MAILEGLENTLVLMCGTSAFILMHMTPCGKIYLKKSIHICMYIYELLLLKLEMNHI